MVNIIIDTSIFKKNPKLDSAAFVSIKNTAIGKKLSIHLPYMVEKEHLSQRIQEYEKELKNVLSSLEKLERKKLNSELNKETKEHIRSINRYAKKMKQFVIDDFMNWINETGTIRHDIDIEKTKRVFEAYFAGLPPFPEAKSRKDIPDSFIYESIKELKIKNDNLHFICEDGNLRKAVLELGDIMVYNSLEEFVESNIYQILLKEEIISKKFELVKEKLPKHQAQVENYIKQNIEYSLIGETFTSYDIPDDNNEAAIEGVNEPDKIFINYDMAKYYGEGIIVIPFELNVEASVEYYLFKAEYYTMDEDRARQMGISDHNEHYFEVEEDFYLKVSGSLSMVLNVKSLDNENEKLFDSDSINIDNIEEIDIIDRI